MEKPAVGYDSSGYTYNNTQNALTSITVQNYFNYFTEIEHRFQQRRGSLLLLSTLDWSLIEIWREAGIPLEAVLRGIDDAFDKYDAREAKSRARTKKINGLAWCAQSVMEAVEQLNEAAIGINKSSESDTAKSEDGFEHERLAEYLEHNAGELEQASLAPAAAEVATSIATRLRGLAGEIRLSPTTTNAEELERTLTVLEEKLFAALTLTADEDEMVRLREQATRELAPHRSKMQATQLKQVQQQFLNKRLLEARNLPRLSLFYMRQS